MFLPFAQYSKNKRLSKYAQLILKFWFMHLLLRKWIVLIHYYMCCHVCDRLQNVQNSAARLIRRNKKCDHITPVNEGAALASHQPTYRLQDISHYVQGPKSFCTKLHL